MATMEAARVVLDQARLQLADQLVRFDNFRSKSFTALAVSGTVAAFFSGRIATAPHGLKVAGIVAFATTAVLAIAIVWPAHLLHGAKLNELDTWLRQYGDDEDAARSLTDSMAHAVIDSLRKNECRTSVTAGLFAAQCMTLGAQFALWLAILAHA